MRECRQFLAKLAVRGAFGRNNNFAHRHVESLGMKCNAVGVQKDNAISAGLCDAHIQLGVAESRVRRLMASAFKCHIGDAAPVARNGTMDMAAQKLDVTFAVFEHLIKCLVIAQSDLVDPVETCEEWRVMGDNQNG